MRGRFVTYTLTLQKWYDDECVAGRQPALAVSSSGMRVGVLPIFPDHAVTMYPGYTADRLTIAAQDRVLHANRPRG